ncbi:Degenerin [Aphelenchoides fujianensis]|nr:Degenerin [Aphelenchoides fujianensis]
MKANNIPQTFSIESFHVDKHKYFHIYQHIYQHVYEHVNEYVNEYFSQNNDLNEHGCHECADDVRFESLNDDHSSAVIFQRSNYFDSRNNDNEQHSGPNDRRINEQQQHNDDHDSRSLHELDFDAPDDHGIEQHELEHNGEQQFGHDAQHASFEFDRPVDHSGNNDEHEHAVHNGPLDNERIDEQQHDDNNEHNAVDDDKCPFFFAVFQHPSFFEQQLNFDEYSPNDADFFLLVVHEHAANDELVHSSFQHAVEFNEQPADLDEHEHVHSIELDGRKFQPAVNGGELDDDEQQHVAFEHVARFLLLVVANYPAEEFVGREHAESHESRAHFAVEQPVEQLAADHESPVFPRLLLSDALDSSAQTSSSAASTSTPRISSSFPPTSARPNATSGAPSTPAASPTSPLPTAQQPTRPPFDFSKLPIPESTANYSIAKLNSLISYFGLNASSNRVALESQVQDRMQQIIADMDPNTREALGYKLRDLVISCAFNQIPCDYDTDFETITDPDYGNCYTYNYNGVHKTARSGTQYGLRLITFSNISDYLYSSSQAGVRVTLSKQNFAVFPNTYGYSVSVGSYVAVPVQYNHIKRLGHPYNQCTKENDTNGQIYNGSYTYEGCLRSCFQQKMVERCGLYCGPTNETAFLCYQKSITSDGDYTAAANCSCFSPCTDPEYSAQLTTAAWPVFFENFTSAQCYQYYPGTTVDCYTAYS